MRHFKLDFTISDNLSFIINVVGRLFVMGACALNPDFLLVHIRSFLRMEQRVTVN